MKAKRKTENILSINEDRELTLSEQREIFLNIPSKYNLSDRDRQAFLAIHGELMRHERGDAAREGLKEVFEIFKVIELGYGIRVELESLESPVYKIYTVNSTKFTTRDTLEEAFQLAFELHDCFEEKEELKKEIDDLDDRIVKKFSRGSGANV